jgi:4-carboxymuconolactone decarboxylase
MVMTTSQPRSGVSVTREITPKLADLTDSVLFGDVWERPQLSKRDRSLITVAVLTALYRTEQLRGHIGRGLDNGLTPDEISEVITHIAFYGGWPVGVNAAQVAKQVFNERGVTISG